MRAWKWGCGGRRAGRGGACVFELALGGRGLAFCGEVLVADQAARERFADELLGPAEVLECAQRARDREPVDDAPRERSGGLVDDQLRPAPASAPVAAEVDDGGQGGGEAVQVGARVVAGGRRGAGGQQSGADAAVIAEPGVPGGVDAAVDRDQPTGLEAVLDGVRADAVREQLAAA